MRLSFHGADRGVTGSCHLIEAEHTYLVHGEEGVMQTVAGLLKNTEVVLPKLHDSVEL